MMPDTIEAETNIAEACHRLRDEIELQKLKVLNLKLSVPEIKASECEDRGEVMANVTLCYRHLEDAKMRLGKVIEALHEPVTEKGE